MIVRVMNDPTREGVWTVTDNANSFVQEAHSDYFPEAVRAATPKPGSFAYFQATRDEKGDLTFGDPSTAGAFAGHPE